jgi:hypothetical protein
MQNVEYDELNQCDMLSKAIYSRREWGRKYGLSRKVLYELFSEFQSMIQMG